MPYDLTRGPLPQDHETLRRRAAEQRDVVRWWAAECRARNAACRARFSTANVAAATEARRALRVHAEAWTKTRTILRAAEAGIAAEMNRYREKLPLSRNAGEGGREAAG